MINWNEVTVDKTTIGPKPDVNMFVVRWHDNEFVLIESVRGGSILLKRKSELNGHVICIYDPWEEITEECEIDGMGCVHHKGWRISTLDQGRYKWGPGLRVWKRKEG